MNVSQHYSPCTQQAGPFTASPRTATLDDELIKSTIDNLVKKVIAIDENKKMKSETDYLTKIAAMTDNLKMFKTLLFVASAVALASSAPADEAQDVKQAIVRLDGDGVTGSVTFTRQDDGKLRITGTVTGMPAGNYGFHIHETGDITKGCGSTGGHFNPNGKDHGHPEDENRHVGDLGNIVFDANKTAHIDFTDHEIKLNGKHNIIGRGLVLHGGTDDYGRTDHPDSKKTGNAGGRVACGVIGIL